MNRSKRDTVTYDLKEGSKIVYRGTTNNLERREQEHQNEGKRFSNMTPTSRRMTEEGAKKKEEKLLKTFRQSHGGRNPRYNKDSDG